MVKAVVVKAVGVKVVGTMLVVNVLLYVWSVGVSLVGVEVGPVEVGRVEVGLLEIGLPEGGRSGRGRTKANGNAEEELEKPNEGYHEVSDDEIDIPPFTPLREQGIHFDRRILQGAMTRELDFFHLFFTREIISSIATNSNIYATTKVSQKSYCRAYVNKEGLWNEISPAEIETLIALLIYFGLVRVDTRTENYWSTKTIYHGLWARKIMSRDRYKSLMAFLHVVDPTTEIPGEKLCNIAALLSQFKDRCKILYQPTQNLAVDERMVKSKHRSGMGQYMKDKPTKWEVLADSDNGYTVDFNVYIGKETQGISKHGLGYDGVMELMEPYLNQGYHLYRDNFYTSELLEHLFYIVLQLQVQ